MVKLVLIMPLPKIWLKRLLQLRFDFESTSIRLRFDYDSTTTKVIEITIRLQFNFDSTASQKVDVMTVY